MLSLGVSASLILQPYLVTRFCQLLLITCHEAWFDVQSSTMNVGRTWEKNIAPKAIDV